MVYYRGSRLKPERRASTIETYLLIKLESGAYQRLKPARRASTIETERLFSPPARSAHRLRPARRASTIEGKDARQGRLYIVFPRISKGDVETPLAGVLPLHIRQYLVGVAGERRKDVLARLKQADGAAVRAVRAGRKTGRRARTFEMPV